MFIERGNTTDNLSLRDKLLLFKEREGFTHVLGIIGGSDNQTQEATMALNEICVGLRKRLGKFAIVCGGTKGGIPEIALDIGRANGLPTIGVFPQDGAKYAVFDKIDFPIPSPKPILGDVTWGSETPVLVCIPNAFVVVGGNWGTMAEVSMILKRNIGLAKKEQPISPVVILHGFGGIENGLALLVKDLPGGIGFFQFADTPKEAFDYISRSWS